MELAALAHATVIKKRVIIQNTKAQIDSMLVTKPNNFNQKLSVSSASEITPISDITMSSSIAQCSENWKKCNKTRKWRKNKIKKEL